MVHQVFYAAEEKKNSLSYKWKVLRIYTTVQESKHFNTNLINNETIVFELFEICLK